MGSIKDLFALPESQPSLPYEVDSGGQLADLWIAAYDYLHWPDIGQKSNDSNKRY